MANEKISSDISMVLHPNMSAVEAIERFASDLQGLQVLGRESLEILISQ